MGVVSNTCLTVGVSCHYHGGDASPWGAYFALLPPDAEPLPYMWDQEEAAELLEGEGVGQ